MPSIHAPIRLLVFDIGGVLMTNGWGHESRKRAADLFHLDLKEFDERHALYFPLHELGIFTLDEYLNHVIFEQPRSFSKEDFIAFMQAESRPFPEMIQWAKELKEQLKVPLLLLSNEGRELGEYRIQKYALKQVADIFMISGAVGLRKPDPAFYKLAFHLAQVQPEEVLYIDDRQALIEAGQELGMRVICHRSLEESQKRAAEICHFTLPHV